MKPQNKNIVFTTILFVIYLILCVISLDKYYFWDNVQQTSKEAHWFYLNDFKYFFMPQYGISNSEITGTGYHPPLMGIMTAFLWKIFGYKLWVSHVFMLFWAVLFFYNTRKLLLHFFEQKYAIWILAILVLEPAVVTQFFIASPDFILLTAFVIALRAILDQNKILISMALFFLAFINMRGVFATGILFFAHQYYVNLHSDKKFNVSNQLKHSLPFFPVFSLLIAYYACYLFANGWFFNTSDKTGHYAAPQNFQRIIKHIVEFILRSVENGRFLVWVLSVFITARVLKSKPTLSNKIKTMIFVFVMLFSLYVLFIFISQMAFSARYFMPYYLILSILVAYFVVKFTNQRRTITVFIAILSMELAGHFWMYPEPIAKNWDTTLAHISYYDLRKQCFNYIDEKNIDYKRIGGGFCFSGNRGFTELQHFDKKINADLSRKYFIYSNISNLPDNELLEITQSGKWKNIREFSKGFIEIVVYEQK